MNCTKEIPKNANRKEILKKMKKFLSIALCAVMVLGILAGCVELQDGASRAGLVAMAAHMPEGPARDELAGLAGTDDESRLRYL